MADKEKLADITYMADEIIATDQLAEKSMDYLFDRVADTGNGDEYAPSKIMAKSATKMEELKKQRDLKRLEADKHVHARAYGPFVDDLKKLKNEKGFDAELRENLTEFMEEHPMVHGAARDFIEQNGLNFSVPELPKGWSGEIADKMETVDSFLHTELSIPQKEQQSQSQGPEM